MPRYRCIGGPKHKEFIDVKTPLQEGEHWYIAIDPYLVTPFTHTLSLDEGLTQGTTLIQAEYRLEILNVATSRGYTYAYPFLLYSEMDLKDFCDYLFTETPVNLASP